MKQIILVIMLSLCSTSLVAFKNIEVSKKEIAATLQKNNPTSQARFKQFCIQYDQSVVTFFDTNNRLPLACHIKHMEKDLATLNNAVSDAQFASVQTMLIDLNQQLQALVTTLKKYTSSRNSIGLAFKMRRFKKLLPTPINKWTEFSLFWSLNHRLSC